MRRASSGLDTIRLLCFMAIAMPNCTRCCPTGFGSCQCDWAWEDCPAQSNGCGSCGSSSSSSNSGCNGATGASPFEAGGAAERFVGSDAAVVEQPSGTLAFVLAGGSTFLVAASTPRDVVRVFRVDVDDADASLAVTPVADVAFQAGDGPSRVVSDGHGRAVVLLRGASAMATVDPFTGNIVSRRSVCADPRALAASGDRTYVACSSGDIATFRAGDAAFVGNTWVPAELGDIAATDDAVTATSRDRFFVVSDAGVTSQPLEGVGAVRAVGGTLLAGVTSDVGMLATSGFLPGWTAPGRVTDIAALGDVVVLVSSDDAYIDGSPDGFVRVSGPGRARSVALADVAGRRVLALQTVDAAMVVFFGLEDTSMPFAFEPF